MQIGESMVEYWLDIRFLEDLSQEAGGGVPKGGEFLENLEN